MDKNEIIRAAYICIRRYREGGLPDDGELVDGLLDVMAEKIAKANGEDVQDSIDDVSNMLALERKMIALETKRMKREVESSLGIGSMYRRPPVDVGIQEVFAKYDWLHINALKGNKN